MIWDHDVVVVCVYIVEEEAAGSHCCCLAALLLGNIFDIKMFMVIRSSQNYDNSSPLWRVIERKCVQG